MYILTLGLSLNGYIAYVNSMVQSDVELKRRFYNVLVVGLAE